MFEATKSAASKAAQHPMYPKLGVREAAKFLGVSPSMMNKLRVTPDVLKGYGLGKQLGAVPVQGYAVPVPAAVA